MTEEVKDENALNFLGLDEVQYGIVVYLASAAKQMGSVVGGEEIRKAMEDAIGDGTPKQATEVVAWLRGIRNLLIQLNASTNFGLSLISQVEDRIIDDILGVDDNRESKETE